MEQFKQFLQSPIGRHLHSFAKTYVTVFIGTYLALNGLLNEIDAKVIANDLSTLNLTDVSTLVISTKFAFVSVLRNLYKLLTD